MPRPVIARALGVDGEGRLLVDRGDRVTAFASGEVSVRRSGVSRAELPPTAARPRAPMAGGQP